MLFPSGDKLKRMLWWNQDIGLSPAPSSLMLVCFNVEGSREKSMALSRSASVGPLRIPYSSLPSREKVRYAVGMRPRGLRVLPSGVIRFQPFSSS